MLVPWGGRRVLRTVGCEIFGLTTVGKNDMEGEDVHFLLCIFLKYICQNIYYALTRPQQSTLNEVLNPVSHQFEVFQSVGVSLEVS